MMYFFLLAAPGDFDHVVDVYDSDKDDPREPGRRPFTAEDGTGPDPDRIVSRWDFRTYPIVERLARAATEWAARQPRPEGTDPDVYIPVDQGPGRSPRFEVIRAFKVGDPVSYGFNGDCYPDGHIARISSGPNYLRIVTTGREGGKPHVYYRSRGSSSWIQQGGTFTLTRGHITKTNWER